MVMMIAGRGVMENGFNNERGDIFKRHGDLSFRLNFTFLLQFTPFLGVLQQRLFALIKSFVFGEQIFLW